MKRLVYWKKFISSQKYKNDTKKGFNLYQAENHALYEEKSTDENHLLFVMEGKMTIRCNQYSTREVLYNQCILIPKSASVEMISIGKCKFIDFIFDELNNICEWDIFEKCNPYYKEVAYDFRPVAVCPPVSRFLDQLEYYFRHGLDCEPFQKLKERELFFSPDQLLFPGRTGLPIISFVG
ncbi:MAG: hypothetical protein LUG51_07990 [Tannerellaceae bacterium]|nr:hypothetical protein [Tannerellaceae bacterium]